MHEAEGYAVRPAAKSDIPLLCQLYFAFHEFHVHGVPDRLRTLGDPARYDPSDLSARLTEIIQGDGAQLIVAELDGCCIGFAEVYVREDAADPLRIPHRYGLLQSLMVHEAHRGRGIGTRLLNQAESWAREQGGTEMRLETWEFPGDPVRFYQRSGYRTLRRTLVRQLAD